MPSVDYLCLAIRYLQFEQLPSLVGRRVGEGIYTLATSNFRWPQGVSYSQMMEVRSAVIYAARRQEEY